MTLSMLWQGWNMVSPLYRHLSPKTQTHPKNIEAFFFFESHFHDYPFRAVVLVISWCDMTVAGT